MYVENRPRGCTYCGAGPWHGREEKTTDRNGDIIVECVWQCARCGNRFASGVIQVIKNEKGKK